MTLQSLDQITAEDFGHYIDMSFDASVEEESPPVAVLILKSVKGLGEPVVPGGRAPFSLSFEGPVEVRLEQQIYWLREPSFGIQGIFLVPVGQNENARTYEAIFS